MKTSIPKISELNKNLQDWWDSLPKTQRVNVMAGIVGADIAAKPWASVPMATKKLMQIMYYNFKNAGAKEEPVERLDEFHTVRYPWQVDYMTSDEYMDSKDQVAICSCGESIDSL